MEKYFVHNTRLFSDFHAAFHKYISLLFFWKHLKIIKYIPALVGLFFYSVTFPFQETYIWMGRIRIWSFIIYSFTCKLSYSRIRRYTRNKIFDELRFIYGMNTTLF